MIRDEKAKKFNYDMEAIFADLKQKQSGRTNVSSRKPEHVAERHDEYAEAHELSHAIM